MAAYMPSRSSPDESTPAPRGRPRCTQERIATKGEGGGIYCENSSLKITNTIINNNTSSLYSGGGICCIKDSSLTITSSTISGNSANSKGGGIFFSSFHPSSMLFITDCIIEKNSSTFGSGGGIYCSASLTIFITGCTISENTAPQGKGGGIYCDSATDIANCNIFANSAGNGGGIYSGGFSSVTNCTISGNTASAGGGGMACAGILPPTVINSIFWENSPDEIYVLKNSYPKVKYSDISGGWSGTNNIDADPLFVNPADGDFHLKPDSPCIDAGDPDSDFPKDDIDGDSRPQGEKYDMGSDEFVS